MSATQDLQVAVVGAGAFGRNHIRVYRELPGVRLAAVVDPRGFDGSEPVFSSVTEMLASGVPVDAASVCTPTSLHHAAGAALLRAGVHVLVEKPIAPTLAEADDLIALAASQKLMLAVGHLERFNPAVAALGPLLRGPMFFEAHRLSVFSPRSLDTDVVLDLMIHDLDIVLQLARSEVREVRAVGLPILSGRTDIANVRVEFASGCVANFTASRVSTERVRKLRFFQPGQYVSVDYARQDLLVIEVQGASLAPRKPEVVPGEPLRLELEGFVRAVRGEAGAVVTGEEARAALALALQVQAAVEEHAHRAGLTIEIRETHLSELPPGSKRLE